MQYSIKLLPSGKTEKVENAKNLSMADFICEHVGCDIFEKVNVRGLGRDYILVIDEEGRLKDDPLLNPFASWLYGFQDHGCPIVGVALVMKLVPSPTGFEFGFLDEQEADRLLAWFLIQRPAMLADIMSSI